MLLALRGVIEEFVVGKAAAGAMSSRIGSLLHSSGKAFPRIFSVPAMPRASTFRTETQSVPKPEPTPHRNHRPTERCYEATTRAACSITSATTSGWETVTECEEWTSVT